MPKLTLNRPSASRLLKLLGLLLTLMPVAACATPISATRFLDTSCSAFQIIHYSKNDTPETQTQVRAANRVWHTLCDKAP